MLALVVLPTSSPIEDARRAIAAADADRDGMLDEREFGRAFAQDAGLREAVWMVFDADGDERLDVEPFILERRRSEVQWKFLVEHCGVAPILTKPQCQSILATDKYWDDGKGGSGTIRVVDEQGSRVKPLDLNDAATAKVEGEWFGKVKAEVASGKALYLIIGGSDALGAVQKASNTFSNPGIATDSLKKDCGSSAAGVDADLVPALKMVLDPAQSQLLTLTPATNPAIPMAIYSVTQNAAIIESA